MPRKHRDVEPGGVYHVYARGNRRQQIFVDDDDRRSYLSVWGSVADELGWHCLAYCLMDNHVHHLIETPRGDLSLGVQLAHGTYGRQFNDTHAKDGHLFQGRFGSAQARAPGVLWYFAGYIALNPVRAQMCELPQQHRWSSYAATVGAADAPHWLGVERLLAFYDPNRSVALERYRQTVDVLRVMGAAGFEPPTSRVGGAQDEGPRSAGLRPPANRWGAAS